MAPNAMACKVVIEAPDFPEPDDLGVEAASLTNRCRYQGLCAMRAIMVWGVTFLADLSAMQRQRTSTLPTHARQQVDDKDHLKVFVNAAAAEMRVCRAWPSSMRFHSKAAAHLLLAAFLILK